MKLLGRINIKNDLCEYTLRIKSLVLLKTDMSDLSSFSRNLLKRIIESYRFLVNAFFQDDPKNLTYIFERIFELKIWRWLIKAFLDLMTKKVIL